MTCRLGMGTHGVDGKDTDYLVPGDALIWLPSRPLADCSGEKLGLLKQVGVGESAARQPAGERVSALSEGQGAVLVISHVIRDGN